MVNVVEVRERVEITDEELDDIMVTALEGGISYWCYKAEVVEGDYKGAPWASHCVSRGGSIRLHVEDDDEKPVLTKERLIQGIVKEAERRGKTVRALIDDIPDADQADNIIQFAVFGSLVYG